MVRLKLVVRACAVCVVAWSAATVWVQAGDDSTTTRNLRAPLEHADGRIPVDTLPPYDSFEGEVKATHHIRESGSYYLRRNLLGEPGKSGIYITAENVTLDLNGFTMRGGGGSPRRPGILVDYPSKSVDISNGAIERWGGYALYAGGNKVAVRNIKAVNNTLGGLYVGRGIVEDCIVTGTIIGPAIHAPAESTIRGCAIFRNEAEGIWAGFQVMISDCLVSDNHGVGIFEGSGVIRNCLVALNRGDGIYWRGGSISGCEVGFNEGREILAERTHVRDCAVYDGDGVGIQLGFRSQATQNSVTSCGTGILATSGRNRMEDNTVTGVDRGIDVDGSGNTVVSNIITNAGVGIDVNGTDNLIVKNSVSEVSVMPYSVVDGNKVGTITNDPATAGPWANFTD